VLRGWTAVGKRSPAASLYPVHALLRAAVDHASVCPDAKCFALAVPGAGRLDQSGRNTPPPCRRTICADRWQPTPASPRCAAHCGNTQPAPPRTGRAGIRPHARPTRCHRPRHQRQLGNPPSARVMVSTKGELPAEFLRDAKWKSPACSRPTRPIANGLFDYRTHLARQGISLPTQVRVPARLAHAGFQTNATVRRPLSGWAQHTLARGLPEQDEPLRLLWAMTLGWKTALTGEVNEPFMKSGTMHIFAISGLHIALIAGILVSLLRVARVPRAWCGAVVIPAHLVLHRRDRLAILRHPLHHHDDHHHRRLVIAPPERPAQFPRRRRAHHPALATAATFPASFQLSFFVVLEHRAVHAATGKTPRPLARR
jgi:hypothetical protein